MVYVSLKNDQSTRYVSLHQCVTVYVPDLMPISDIKANFQLCNKNPDFPYNFVGYNTIEFIYKGNFGYKANFGKQFSLWPYIRRRHLTVSITQQK